MDKTIYIGIAFGLMGLGCVFIIWDYFMVKLSERVNPPGSPLTKEEWMLTFETDEERRRYRFRRKNYQAIMAHRMRRGGFVVLGVGLLGLVISLLLGGQSSFPSQDIMLRIANLLYGKVILPWGRINIVGGIILLSIGVFLLCAGIEHLKRKPKPWIFPAVLCFLLSLFLVLEGIFQWQ